MTANAAPPKNADRMTRLLARSCPNNPDLEVLVRQDLSTWDRRECRIAVSSRDYVEFVTVQIVQRQTLRPCGDLTAERFREL
jgi:hypothetical protein